MQRVCRTIGLNGKLFMLHFAGYSVFKADYFLSPRPIPTMRQFFDVMDQAE
jgi:hypothetical protein